MYLYLQKLNQWVRLDKPEIDEMLEQMHSKSMRIHRIRFMKPTSWSNIWKLKKK